MELKSLLPLVGALLVGLIWLRKILETSSEDLTPDERARSLREALGLPPDQLPPPPVKQRTRPAGPVSLPRIEPQGRVSAGNPRDNGMNPQRRMEAQSVNRSQGKSQAPGGPSSEVSLPVASEGFPPRYTAVEQIALPELEVPKVEEFTTASSQVMAVPSERSSFHRLDAYAIDPKNGIRPGHMLQDWLRDPSRLRSAILIQEVLGPPRSLHCIE